MRKRNIVLCCFLAFISVVLTLPALSFGHSIFIQSGRYTVSKGKGSPLFFCYGHHFPVDEAVRAKKLKSIKIVDPEKSVSELAIKDEKSLHSYQITYDKAGTYVLVAETNPGFFAMYTDKKGRKRHSLKPLDTFVDKAQSVQTSMRSSQWAKTWIVSEEPSATFPAVSGLPLELVPQNDPTSLNVGDSITFNVYSNGQKYQGEGFWDATYGGFSTVSEDMYIQRTEIENGTFTLPLKESGRWFVRFFTKTDSPEELRDKFLTEKRTTTVTFLVHNERKRPKISHY